MAETRLGKLRLNEAFGFATIVAALDVIKKTLGVPFSEYELAPVLFLVYFFVFRIKMYADDEGHDFAKHGLLDIGVAVLSWIAFLISVAALEKSFVVAVEWFAIALIVSTVWVWIAMLRAPASDWPRYLWFFGVNVVHVLGLLAVLRWGWTLMIVALIAVVAVDGLLTPNRADGGGPDPEAVDPA